MGRKDRSLVAQHVENLSSDALETYAEILREIVGSRHGVYALYKRRKLYYVGLASSLRSRLTTHLRDRHRGLWDHFSVYLTIDAGHLRELESLVVRIAQPQGNRQKGRLRRSVNLLKELKRRFKERQTRDWLALIGRESTQRQPTPSRRRLAPKNGRVPPLAAVTKRGFTIRATHKGIRHSARVRRDGTIRIDGKVVQSPTTAAKLVTGTTVNGWKFWRYERRPGTWSRLEELRRT